MNQQCGNCNALKSNGKMPSLCCNGGQVQLPPIRSPPEELIGHLFNDENHGHTMKYIKYMNSLCSLASIAVKEERVLGYNQTYKIEGVMHHHIGALMAQEGKRVKHLQVFFSAPQRATARAGSQAGSIWAVRGRERWWAGQWCHGQLPGRGQTQAGSGWPVGHAKDPCGSWAVPANVAWVQSLCTDNQERPRAQHGDGP